MSAVKVDIRQLPHGEGLALPVYQSAHAAGLDLLAAVPEDTPMILAPGKFALIPTGLTIALPRGMRRRSVPLGLAAKHGVTVLNAPGTVDADYRGEIGVLLINPWRCAVPDPARRAHRADGDCAGDPGGTGSGNFPHCDRARQWAGSVRPGVNRQTRIPVKKRIQFH